MIKTLALTVLLLAVGAAIKAIKRKEWNTVLATVFSYIFFEVALLLEPLDPRVDELFSLPGILISFSVIFVMAAWKNLWD